MHPIILDTRLSIMQVAIIGYGVEGKSALHYWQGLGAKVTICDQNEQIEVPPHSLTQLGPDYLYNLGRFDIIVRSAGIRPAAILAVNPGVADKITTVVAEFFRVCPTKHIIGITGTKGKGTTSTLIARMLEAGGHQVCIGGNIGFSPLEFLPELTADSWVVLELSSFQLTDLPYSPPIAVCLMMAPDHLNWHADMDDYVEAKSQLFRHQTAKDTAIYYAKNETSYAIASNSPGSKIPYFARPGAHIEHNEIKLDGQVICQTSEVKLLGKHNWENVCAAATVLWQIKHDIKPIRAVATTFSGLPHRLEFVRELAGVKFYNDSFASAPPAAEAAIDAISAPKVIIMGGFDRMLPLNQLADAIKDHENGIRQILLSGARAARMGEMLHTIGFHNYKISNKTTMPAIVAQAQKLAKTGDAVLLSPGFASFDMFKNFEDRGRQFKESVQAL
jgi:UDP-N-acetylmuramoylalanine--D-glutamate ligase